MILNSQTRPFVQDGKIIESTSEVTIFIEKMSKSRQYYQLEVELMKKIFTLTGIEFTVKEIESDVIQNCALPALKMKQNFISKEKIIDSLCMIFSDFAVESPNGFQENIVQEAIVTWCKKLQHCTEYFLYFDGQTRFHGRDPYWTLMNPLKKLNHFKKMQNLYKYHESLGFLTRETVLYEARQIFTDLEKILEKFKIEKNQGNQIFSFLNLAQYQKNSFLKQKALFIDSLVLTTLNFINNNISDSSLAGLLNSCGLLQQFLKNNNIVLNSQESNSERRKVIEWISNKGENKIKCKFCKQDLKKDTPYKNTEFWQCDICLQKFLTTINSMHCHCKESQGYFDACIQCYESYEQGLKMKQPYIQNKNMGNDATIATSSLLAAFLIYLYYK